MRILCILNGGMETASARERVLRYLPDLARNGIEAEIHVAGNVAPGFLGRIRYGFWLFRALGRCHAVLIHRIPLSASERSLLRKSGLPVLFDVDDAVWYAVEPGPGGAPQPSPRYDDLTATMRLARRVRAGNRELAGFAESQGIPATLAPTCVQFPEVANPPSKGPAVVGWIGHSCNFRHLEKCAPALLRLAQERPGIRLRVVADRAPDLPGVPVDFAPWSLEGESSMLRSMDIGIMPLEDTPWTRGKCGYKLLLYMAHGIPVVASPVGVNAELVRHGVNGYAARTEDEWVASLKELTDRPDLRAEMGRQGRAQVQGRFDHATGFQNLLRDLRQAAASS